MRYRVMRAHRCAYFGKMLAVAVRHLRKPLPPAVLYFEDPRGRIMAAVRGRG